MPRYAYHCDSCDSKFEVVHGMTENIEICELCSTSGSLNRIPQMTFVFKKASKNDAKVGSIVEEYIENTKKDLKKEKDRIKKEEYEP